MKSIWVRISSPFAVYRANLGFVLKIVRAQTLMPRLVEAQAKLEKVILFEETTLARALKERIFLVVAASRRDSYGVTMRSELLGAPQAEIDGLLADYRSAGLPAEEVALVDFCLKLAHWGPWIEASDWKGLREKGFSEDAIHEGLVARRPD